MIDKIRLFVIVLGFIGMSCSSDKHYEKTIRKDSGLDKCKFVKQLFDKNNFNFQRPWYSQDTTYLSLERTYINKLLLNNVLSKFDPADKATVEVLLNTGDIKQIQTFGRKCVLFVLKKQGIYPFNYSTTYLLFHDHRDNNTKECYFIHIHDKILYRKDIDSNWIYFKGKIIWTIPGC